jgi:hypothetical protein
MSEPTTTPTAVFYLRTARSGDKHMARSVATQRDACQRRANELGAIVQGVYIDVVSGNSAPADRPILSLLIEELKQRPATYVITYDHSRIACKMQHYASIAWTVGRAGSLLEIATLPHREVDDVGAYLIARIGSVQLTDITPKSADDETPDDQ